MIPGPLGRRRDGIIAFTMGASALGYSSVGNTKLTDAGCLKMSYAVARRECLGVAFVLAIAKRAETSDALDVT